MRINVYAEEITDRVELITKANSEGSFTGVRFYLELPATDSDGRNVQGPFIHRPGDDDSAAVTFWGKRKLKLALQKALALLEEPSDTSGEGQSNLTAERDDPGSFA